MSRFSGTGGKRVLASRGALFLFLGLVALLAGCASADPIVVPPLLYEQEAEPDLITHVFPMFLSGWEDRPSTDETRTYGLWPLYKIKREGRELQIGALGAYFYRRRVDHRGFEKLDVLIPPVFYGHSVDQGSYLTIFPFGGTMKGLLGKSYALGVLFPLYLYTEDNRGVGPARRAEHEGGEPAPNEDVFVSQHVLFPFVNWVHGHGRSGFRVFPFYAHYERHDLEGREAYERTWILWPLWTHQKNNLNTSRGEAGAQEMWFLVPFFGYSHGPKTTRWTVLWPFAKYYENRGTLAGGPYWEFKSWPFFTIAHGRDRDQLDIWPLWGHKERLAAIAIHGGQYDHFERTFLLWPFLRWEHHETNALDYHKWWLLPFLWHYHTDDKEKKQEKDEFKIWPLFRRKSWPDGRVTINIFSPLWFNDPEGAFEMIYNPLFRIYESGRLPDGDERHLYAWGLVQHYENERRTETWVHPFLYWNEARKDQSARDDNFLFGLFQIHRRGRERALRFFWLPEWPSWTADDDDSGARK